MWEKDWRECKPGQIYTLTGDLGVGKPYSLKASQQDLESQSLSAVRHLPLFRSMRVDVFRYTILMYTVSVISRKWKKSDTMTISSDRESA